MTCSFDCVSGGRNWVKNMKRRINSVHDHRPQSREDLALARINLSFAGRRLSPESKAEPNS